MKLFIVIIVSVIFATITENAYARRRVQTSTSAPHSKSPHQTSMNSKDGIHVRQKNNHASYVRDEKRNDKITPSASFIPQTQKETEITSENLEKVTSGYIIAHASLSPHGPKVESKQEVQKECKKGFIRSAHGHCVLPFIENDE